MKTKLFLIALSMIIPQLILADDHTDYIHFRNEAATLIQNKEYKQAEKKIESADFYAVSNQDKADLANLRSDYNKALSKEISAARALYDEKKYEECINLLMPLEGTIQDKAIQYWIGNSYARKGMLVLGKKYLENGVDKYGDAWCAYSLGWLYCHSDKEALGISITRAKELLLMGSSATNVAYDELGALYENATAYNEAIKYYKQSQTNYGTSRIAHIVLGGYANLPNDEALSYIRKAAADGDLEAIYGLGMIIYYGQYGLTPNRKQGRDLVSQAAQKGHKSAKSTLNNLISY